MNQFRIWKANGRKSEAFALRYRSGKAKVPAALAREFVRACLAPGAGSMLSAHRNMKAAWRDGELKRPHKFRLRPELPFSYATFCRCVSRELRAAIIDFQQAQRALCRARERIERISSD